MSRGGIKASGGRKHHATLAVVTTPTVVAVSPTPTAPVIVTYPDPVVTGGVPPYTVDPSQDSGTLFPVGTTVVTVDVTDSTGTVATAPDPISVVVVGPSGSGTGATVRVNAGGDLQAAINAAVGGDTIEIEAGATFVGNYELPVKSGSSYITLRASTADGSLPGATTRILPANLGLLPTIRSAGFGLPAFATVGAAHHYRFLAVALGPVPSAEGNILNLGAGPTQTSLSDVPHDLIIDRCYIYGDPTIGQKRGISLQSATTTIINSYIQGIRKQGQDSQAIACSNGPGPYLIENNYLEAASENVLFGGDDPDIPNLVPSDITFRGNYCFKPLAWQSEGGWNVKNLFELKNAQRVLIENNVFENTWADAQVGHAILFTIRNQGGGANWSTIKDVTCQYNVVKNCAQAVFSLLGLDDTHTSVQGLNMSLAHILALGCGQGFFSQDGYRPTSVTHCTLPTVSGKLLSFLGSPMPSANYTYQNNVAASGAFGITGDGTTIGTVTWNTYAPGGTFTNNVVEMTDERTIAFPTGTTIIAPNTLASRLDSEYRYTGPEPSSDGGTMGADINAIKARIPWLVLP